MTATPTKARHIATHPTLTAPRFEGRRLPEDVLLEYTAWRDDFDGKLGDAMAEYSVAYPLQVHHPHSSPLPPAFPPAPDLTIPDSELVTVSSRPIEVSSATTHTVPIPYAPM